MKVCRKGMVYVRGLHYVILHCAEKLRGERTIAAVYHLFNGKRSGQTIQDGHVYGLLAYFSMFKGIQEESFYNDVRQLVNEELLIEKSTNTYVVTKKGEDALTKYTARQSPLPHLDGYAYGEEGRKFWRHFSLLIQTLAHLQQQQKGFIPLEDHPFVQERVRKYLLNSPCKKISTLTEEIEKEVSEILGQLPQEEATIFVKRLTGFQQVGQTFEQIAEFTKLDLVQTYLRFYNGLHFFCKQVNETKNYPFLKELYPFEQQSGLSNSTNETLQLLKEGYSINAIAKKRRLKQSTIEDHIVELVVNKSEMDVFQFLSHEHYTAVLSVVKELNTNKLKRIKEHLPPNVTYFVIRLVLAKEGARDI